MPALLTAVLLLLPASLGAQRDELTVIGGPVASPSEEFDRVYSSTFGPSSYTRERGRRESGAALGLTATFAIRGHVFAEIGIMSHGIERQISRTGSGDPTGPFLVTDRHDGRLTTLWVGPMYRVVDRERLAVGALVSPMLVVMQGAAFEFDEVAYNAPTRRTAMGLLVGLRARYWLGERLGVQLALEDAMWTVPLQPHPSDGTPAYPDSYRETPRQHDLRLHLGAAFALF